VQKNYLLWDLKMTLKNWLNNGWLRPHKTSIKEIADLLMIVESFLPAVLRETSLNMIISAPLALMMQMNSSHLPKNLKRT